MKTQVTTCWFMTGHFGGRKLYVVQRNTVILAKSNLKKKKKSNQQPNAYVCASLSLHSSSFVFTREENLSSEVQRREDRKPKWLVNLNSAEIEYPNNCQTYKKPFWFTRCYHAWANAEEGTQHEALLCLTGLIYETDDLLFIDQRLILLTELRRSLIKGNHASHLVMSKNHVYWLAVSTDFDATTSRCSTCANFKNKTKQHNTKQNGPPLPQKREKRLKHVPWKKNSSGMHTIVWNVFLNRK